MIFRQNQQMLMNWPERVWIYSPLRVVFQKHEVRKFLELGLPKETENALEIGCGLGRGARLIHERMGFKQVFAFDLETILVKRSIHNLRASLKPNIHFLVSDAQFLPFPDQNFNAVFNFGIIHHVLDWRLCLTEIFRVMRPQGIFYFEEIYPPLYANWLLKRMLRHPTSDRFYEAEFLGALETIGFNLVSGVKTGSRFGVVGAALKP
ncbi:MAG: class I SAM-dependent methyltransferase [Desulfomonilaceae bacterium]